MATKLIDLIESVNADDLPTNEFTIEDKDPMVILGKLNEVIAYLQTLQATINASDSKANEALQRAIQAVNDATQALSVANGIDSKATQALANAIEAVSTANTALSASNTALSTANTAISTANTALSSANNAVETAGNALDTAESAETKADTAITTANGAKTTAEGIDAKATTALSNSQTAVSTANDAKSTAEEALDQVVAGLGTKVYRDSKLLSTLDIKPIEDDIANNATAINNEATTRANAINALDNAKVDKVAGKQLSTEDYTMPEKTKLAGLYNYNDTEVKADITALQTRATNIETKNNEQDSSIETINNKFNNYLKIADILNKIYPVGSIYMSINYTSPAMIFGGTWEEIHNKFLLAAGDHYSAGATGGSATHTLTIDEMPSHRHSSDSYMNGYASNVIDNEVFTTWVNSGQRDNNNPNTGQDGPVRTSYVGGGQPHNNMPPYLVVYIWKRTE